MPPPKKKADPKAAARAAKVTEPSAPDDDVEVEDLDEALEVIPYTYSITAYGADYPVDSIKAHEVGRHHRSALQLGTRERIWDRWLSARIRLAASKS